MFIKEVIGSVAWIVLSVVFYLQALDLPSQRGATMGAGFFPKVLCGLIILFSLINLAKVLTVYFKRNQERGPNLSKLEVTDKIPPSKEVQGNVLQAELRDFRSSVFSTTGLRIVVLLSILLAYLFLMPILGYVISTIGFSLALMRFHGMRKPTWLFGGSLVISLSILVVFQYWLKVPLPKMWIF
jgi:hypothetical protein